jgi:hypothetical protein
MMNITKAFVKNAFSTKSLLSETCSQGNQGKVIEKTLSDKSQLFGSRAVLGIVPFGGPFGTIPELLSEKKQLILALQQSLVSH